MMNASKPISAETLKRYHREDYASRLNRYYTDGQQLNGHWHGRLAAELGLVGRVSAEQFDRLADGRDPNSGIPLIQHRSGKAVEDGREMTHRAGYDLTFSAPKSVSLTALVGGDERVRVAHRLAVKEAADFVEQTTQAR